jgi:hypothetical protein
MKKAWTLAIVLLCAGCQTQPSFREFVVRTLAANYASVQVVNDAYIVVSQEPIYVQQETDNAVYWSLPPGGPYYFPPKGSAKPGIVFDPPRMPQTDCYNYNGDRYTFVCTYKKANKKKYTYAINVTKDGTNIITSDPTVMND